MFLDGVIRLRTFDQETNKQDMPCDSLVAGRYRPNFRSGSGGLIFIDHRIVPLLQESGARCCVYNAENDEERVAKECGRGWSESI